MSDDLLPIQIDALRRMTPAERFERGLKFLQLTREWLAAGVRQRHPEWPEEKIMAETRRLIDHARD
jgi:hypothetical protein